MMKEKDIARLRALNFHIMSLLAQKDRETLGHCRRVGRVYAAFAEFGWDCWGESVSIIELIGEIHDAGKIVMPNRALKSSGQLHGYEHILKENHPKLGAEMVPLHLSIVRDPILCHHERVDGKGYPRRLKGEAIPVPALALSIVDTYDAMRNGRAHQSAKTVARIMKELKDNEGRQFDADVLETFREFTRSHKRLLDQVYPK
jgi:HD-GYP domain-containing protein (c-di-GMP phosphodiesterase class II)